MDVNTRLARITDPMVSMRFRQLYDESSGWLAALKANPTDLGAIREYASHLKCTRREMAVISMTSTYHLGEYRSGPAVVAALDTYYGAGTADPALWTVVVSSIGALVTEATGMAVKRVAQEKEKTVQEKEKNCISGWISCTRS